MPALRRLKKVGRIDAAKPVTGTITKWAEMAHEFKNRRTKRENRRVVEQSGVYERMRKAALLFVLLPVLAVAGFAQESRQDASVGVTGVFPPYVYGNTVHQYGRDGMGGLVSYRYLLTPRSAVEGNYQYSQNAYSYLTSFNNVRVHTRMQEVSAAYVFNFTYKKFNPFLEGGIGGYIFAPILDGTTTLDARRQTEIGGLYGAGIAYEISPSFDLRAEFRGIVVKAPNFDLTNYKTNRWLATISNPVVGIAYHF